MMSIETPCVVSLTWRLSDAQGQTIDQLEQPLEFLVGGNDLLPKVEQALQGQQAGQELHLHLEPEHAFGDYDARLVCFEARTLFPESLEVGMQFEGLPAGSQTPDMPDDGIYTVTEVYPSHVVLDANHPLAGMALRLDVKVHSVREADDDEVAAGTTSHGAVTVLDTLPPASRLH